MLASFFGLTRDDLEGALDVTMSRGAEFAEVFLERRVVGTVHLEGGCIRSTRAGCESGIAVRAHSGERSACSSIDEVAPGSLLRAAAAAAAIATGASKVHGVRLAPAPPGRPRETEPLEGATIEQQAALARRIEAAARAEGPLVRKVIASVLSESRWFCVANSEGLMCERRQRLAGATATVVVQQGEERQRGYFAAGGRDGLDHFATVTPEAIAREAVRRARAQLGAVAAPAGPQPVVIGNGWGGVLLHEAVGHGFEADYVRRGTSSYAGRVGERVGSPLCTIIDDGTLPGLRGSVEVDDEGVAAGPTPLVEQGILQGYLHDRLSARLMSAALTGNGRRQSFRDLPIPRQTNLYLAAGDDDPQDILRGVTKGLYARHLGGGQVDITSGSFVFQVAEGYLIEEGRVTAPVRNTNLIGVGHEVISRISRVGHDLSFDSGMGLCGKESQSVPVGVGQPTILVSELTVGGTRL